MTSPEPIRVLHFADLHVGIEKEQARTSASVVFGVSLALTVVVALKLFGAF